MGIPESGTGAAPAARPRRSRWLYALAALPPIVGILTALLAPEPHGHWVEHFSSVGFKSTQLAVLLALLALLGWRALSAPLAVALVVIGAGIALQVDNIRNSGAVG